MNKTIFLLDNFDSFTYNLVDELRSMGNELVVYRNSVSANHIFEQMQVKSQSSQVLLLLSPGPGAPSDAGCMAELIKSVQGKFAILGICLGHQAIVQHYGGDIVRADSVMHGKASAIQHCGDKMFTGLMNPLPVARYHSLMAGKQQTMAATDLDVVAEVDSIPMAVLHEKDNMLGFQFHPESILTSQGSQLLQQSIDYLTSQERIA